MTTVSKEREGPFPLVAALDASGVVGAWDWDNVARVAVYDRGAAELLAGDAALAGLPLPGAAATSCIHPEDVAGLVEETLRAAGAGGLFLSEYRVVAHDGRVRWLLSRGRTFLDETGQPLRSRGILIDITEGREDGYSYVACPPAGTGRPLEAAAEHLACARDLLDGVAGLRLRAALDIALMEVATVLASSIRPDRTKRH